MRVRHLYVRGARHAHPAVPTPVSVQLVRRQPALSGQQLPHLSRALPCPPADPGHEEEAPERPSNPAGR